MTAKLKFVDRARSLITSALGKALAGSFAVSIVARLAQLAMAIMLARQLGPVGYGTFTFALGGAILAGQFASLGWPTLMARYIPQYTVDENLPLLRGLVRAGDAVVLVGTLAVAAFIYLMTFLSVVPKELGAGLALAALLAVPMGFRLLRRQQLASVKKPALGLAFDELLAPVAVVLVSIGFGTGTASQAFFVYAAASLVGVVLATFYLRKFLPKNWNVERPVFEMGMWMGVAMPMVVAIASRVLLNRIDVVMLAPLSTFEQVGYYASSFRLTFLIGFIPHVASVVIWPLIAELYTTNKLKKLKNLLVAYTVFLFISAAVFSAVLFFYATPIMNLLFGADFIPATQTLKILAISQFFAAQGVVGSSLLLMTGRQGAFGILNFGAVIINVILNFMLVPLWHAQGAAIATLATNAILTMVVIVVAVKHMRIIMHNQIPLAEVEK